MLAIGLASSVACRQSTAPPALAPPEGGRAAQRRHHAVDDRVPRAAAAFLADAVLPDRLVAFDEPVRRERDVLVARADVDLREHETLRLRPRLDDRTRALRVVD